MSNPTKQTLQAILQPGESVRWQRLTEQGFSHQVINGSSYCWNCHRQTEDLITPTGRRCCAKCGVEK